VRRPPQVLPLVIAAVCAATTPVLAACGNSGEAHHHFVELAPDGQLIRAE
jgi:hypothetical protein